MTFTPPTITTSLSTTTFRNQLNANFLAIDNALKDIANELPQVTAQVQMANLTWVERAIRDDGVVGNDSFVIAFNTDGDVFTINHNAPDGYSSCMINKHYHQTNAVYEKAFSDLCTSDGVWDLVFGVKSRGAPGIDMKLVVDGTDVDLDVDLVIWRFSVTRASSVYTLSNLRLVPKTLMNRQAFIDVYDFYNALPLTYAGTLPGTTGPLAVGWILPWDCEIEGAYMRIETAPDQTDGVSIDIYHDADTDSDSILNAPATWSSAEATVVKHCDPKSQRVQLAAGTYVYPYVTVADATAANLSITLLARRIAHTIY